ncbi:siderophore-interacting protein [Pollutimonas nitritireducens]|uniref:Siderophore-interacting protein n=1 Tax=Pollutimonas nitritireducens TaxID=2045209 RepID=A0A2N4UFM8_9BURK|nr:MucB/RseB C-terminal domain-containing protein [Pollutimonas nitritireducens]PLC53824.1 siderophore-interacting protein [Pollutimonas nitritireducens]
MAVVGQITTRFPLNGIPQRVAGNLVCYLLVLTATVVLARTGQAAETTQTSPDPGIVLLQKVQAAARGLDYSGVYTYQQGTMMVSSRVVHIVDGTGERERIEMLDGPAREYVRHNDVTQCLIPEKKLIVLERRRGDRFPGMLLDDGKNIPANYIVKISESHNRIAGRECTIVELVPKDQQRYGYRICTDSKTNLLLKAQTLDSDRAVIDQISFNSLQVGDTVASQDLTSSWNTRGWEVIETPMDPVNLAKDGWRIPFPSGFHALTQVSRPMKAGRKVKQLVVSDGVAAISVFIEPFDDAHDNPLAKGAMRKGAMNVFRTRIDDYWLTALGEVPAQTLRDIAERTEYVPAAGNK